MGSPGGNSKRKKAKGGKKKKGGKSGNPMKRAQEEQALRERLAGKPSSGTGSAGSAFEKPKPKPGLPDESNGFPGGLPSLPPSLFNR
jgi:signal recognition particle subunit SRP54